MLNNKTAIDVTENKPHPNENESSSFIDFLRTNVTRPHPNETLVWLGRKIGSVLLIV